MEHVRIPLPGHTGPTDDLHEDAARYLLDAADDPDAPARDLLTNDEHAVMDMTADLANALRAVIGDGEAAAGDWNEVAASIHRIQHSVLAQAAARAYPDRYRLLGGTLVRP